jgi:hypothetical protein
MFFIVGFIYDELLLFASDIHKWIDDVGETEDDVSVVHNLVFFNLFL